MLVLGVRQRRSRQVILWDSYMGGGQSLGVVGEHTVVALARSGFDVRARPWNLSRQMRRALFANDQQSDRAGYPWGKRFVEEIGPEVSGLIDAGQGGIDMRAERHSLGITWAWLSEFLHPYWRHVPVRAGYAFHDRTTISAIQRRAVETVDTLFVPSNYVRHNLVRDGVTVPIDVWPHGVDTSFFTYAPPPNHGPFTFLFVGVAQKRKGVSEIVSAFRAAFPASVTDVRLVVKSADWGDLSALRDGIADARIEWLHQNLSRAELRALLWQCHCLVVASRAESFCLPALEAMAVGRPVITVAYGGQLDFCSPSSGYLVPVERMEPMLGRFEAKVQGYTTPPEWAVVSVEALAETLRHVYRNPEECKTRGDIALNVARGWTWEAGVHRIASVLHDLLSTATAEAIPTWS